MNIIGNLESKMETVQRAGKVQILVSFLPEESIAEDAHGYGLISSFCE